MLVIIVVYYVLRMPIDTISSKGYKIKPRRSTRHPAQYLTDTDVADDIALTSESLVNAQSLLQSLEQSSNCVGLYLNEKKTEYINKCNNDSDFVIKTIQDKLLQMVSDNVYLGSYISSISNKSTKYFMKKSSTRRSIPRAVQKSLFRWSLLQSRTRGHF